MLDYVVSSCYELGINEMAVSCLFGGGGGVAVKYNKFVFSEHNAQQLY